MRAWGWLLAVVMSCSSTASASTFKGGAFPAKGNVDDALREMVRERVFVALNDEGLGVEQRWSEEESGEFRGRISACSAPCRATLIDRLNVDFVVGIGVWQRLHGGEMVLALTVWRVNGDRYEVVRAWEAGAAEDVIEREVRDLATELRSRFDGHVARLRVAGGPEGLLVRVAGEPWGRAPVERQVEEPGVVTVVLEAPGYVARRLEVEVPEGRTVEIDGELELELEEASLADDGAGWVAADETGREKKGRGWVAGPVLVGVAGGVGAVGVAVVAQHQSCTARDGWYGACSVREEGSKSAVIGGAIASGVAITGAVIWAIMAARSKR